MSDRTTTAPLPTIHIFPEPGTTEFEELNQRARQGEFVFGPREGGGQLVWKMKETPHGLFGGKTGSGKSVALSVPLFFGLYNPDLVELIVCEPKNTDFAWTPEFPNVIQFATTDTEIAAAITRAEEEMDRRQSLLREIGGRDIDQLRAKMAANPQLVEEYGPPPRHLILLVDEIAEFLAHSADKDLEELKDEARADLEKIGRLGRALGVNLVVTTQRAGAKPLSTQLRSQLGFRLGVGPLDQYESEQILQSGHGTRFPESDTPKGRAWGYDPKGGYQMAQVMFLADETGIKDMVRQRLQDLGYVHTQIISQDGGPGNRWAPVGEVSHRT